MLSSAAGLLTDQSFLSVFCAAMLTIGIGWGLRKKNILKAESRPVLNALLLKLTVPCLAFDAFMTDFARGELRRNVQILLISFALYLSIIALSQLIFIKYGRRKANLYGICFAIGQQTLYAMPILRAIYRENPSESMLSASMVAIAFRVMLYLYAFYSISGVALTGGSLTQNLTKAFMIGSTLGESRLGDALRDGKAWFIAFLRMFIAPLYTLAVLCLLQQIGWTHFTEVTLMTVVMCFAAPLSAVLCTFFITYQEEADMAARVCLLSTLFCVLSTPLFYCLVKAAVASGAFPI